MCFILDEGKINGSPKVTEKNMTVYKVMKLRGKLPVSYYMPKIWNIGEVVKEGLGNPSLNNYPYPYYGIDKGLHSYFGRVKCIYSFLDGTFPFLSVYGKEKTDMHIANYYISPKEVFFDNLIIAKCVIPKGSKYLMNEDFEIISDALKIAGYVQMDKALKGSDGINIETLYKKFKSHEDNGG